jgi:hypothetical protein
MTKPEASDTSLLVYSSPRYRPPIISTTGDQPRPIAGTLDAETEAVFLDFVEPLWTSWDLDCIGRHAEFKRLKHAAKIGIGGRFCESR